VYRFCVWQGKGKGGGYYHYGYGVSDDYRDNDDYSSKSAYRGFLGSGGKGGGKGRHHYATDDVSYESQQLRGYSKGNSKGRGKGKGGYH
jgi:hypothetical protein